MEDVRSTSNVETLHSFVELMNIPTFHHISERRQHYFSNMYIDVEIKGDSKSYFTASLLQQITRVALDMPT